MAAKGLSREAYASARPGSHDASARYPWRPRGRREFLSRTLAATAALAMAPSSKAFGQAPPSGLADLRGRYPDLERHFLFEYYPWYGGPPAYEHWDYLDRHPPLDLSTRYMPRLGPYDVRSTATLEQHARSIRDAGIGGVALSWWGRGSWQDRAVPLILDVLHAHDLKATFALEPYADDRARYYASDVLYLLREYGEKRHWDAFLLLRNAFGRIGPVFKSFRTVLPEASTNCLGETREVPDYTPDAYWRRQTDTLRDTLRADFDHVTLLADSLAFPRAADAGFSGIGTYDNFIPPEDYRGYAEGASRAGLVFSFHVNPGYDQIEPRETSDPCYAPRAFAPPLPGLDFSLARGPRARRRRLGRPDPGLLERDARAPARSGSRQRARRLPARVRQLLQRVARGPRLRADEGRGRAHAPTSGRSATATRRTASYRLQALAELQRQVLAPAPAQAPTRRGDG